MSELDSDHRDVCKLLRWKRNEQPPPAYFASFSDKVLARLEAEEAAEKGSWWNWLVARFDARPVLVCAYGVAISGLLLVGFRLSQMFEAEVAATPTVNGGWLAVTPSSPILFPSELTTTSIPGMSTAAFVSSTRSALEEETGALFFPRRNSYLQHAGFAAASH